MSNLEERLTFDTPFYCENLVKIEDVAGRVIPLTPKRSQLEFDALLEEQRLAGKPMRGIILKARKLGFSTWVQSKVLQRTTRTQNHNSLVIAQNNDTASELFGIAETIYTHLPDIPGVKPPIANARRATELVFGEANLAKRRAGHRGINSSMKIGSAREFQAGRGLTIHSLHLSEVAFYPDLRRLTALLNAVGDDPTTMIVQESTANGYNHFRQTWIRAMEGRSDYVPYFAAWHDEPSYQRPFSTVEEREAFDVGEGPWGEEETDLIDQHGCTLEQLNWRRYTIENKNEADLRTFHQEYPADWQQAFLSTGQAVFSPILVDKLLRNVEVTTDPPRPMGEQGPARGLLHVAGTVTRPLRHGTVEMPTSVDWVPRAASGFVAYPWWRVWEPPIKADGDTEEGRYVIAVDPQGDRLTSSGDNAYGAIQVINHRTLEQAAEYRSHVDPDELAMQSYLAALYWNKAWIAPEITGGYGLAVIQRLVRDFKWPYVYRRSPAESRHEKMIDRYGWGTDRTSKTLIEDGMKELLREGTTGIRSRLLAMEMMTFVRDEQGKSGPEDDAFSDLLMAYMIAQQVARVTPIRRERQTGTVTSTRPINPKTGY